MKKRGEVGWGKQSQNLVDSRRTNGKDQKDAEKRKTAHVK